MSLLDAERANDMESEIRGHPGFRLLLDICGDDRIVRLYKGSLAMRFEEPAPFRLPRLKFLCLAAWLFLLHLNCGGFVMRRRPSGIAAVPCLWGVFQAGMERKIAGVRRFNDDMYLYGNHFKPGDVLHIFGDWEIPESGKQAWRGAMDAQGIPHADRKDFGVNFALLWLTVRVTWRVLREILRDPFHAPAGPRLWRITFKGLYHWLLKHYETENVDYKVEVVKNDYNPGHVAATIASNAAGRKRIGVSHVSSAVDSPQICFVHFDKYATVCPMQEKWHGRFWGDLPLARVGKESIDSIVAAMKDREAIQRRLDALYPTRKHTVTILFPGNAERCLVPQWDKMYEALTGFSGSDIDARVFLRFRRVTEAMEVPHMARFLRLPGIDSRFILEHDRFTTHELMAASDLVIVANASFAINEALVIGKPVFTFDYTLKAEQYLGMYDPGIILTEPGDVLRTIKDIKHLDSLAVEWQEIRKDADYHFDGKNRERLALAVKELLA